MASGMGVAFPLSPASPAVRARATVGRRGPRLALLLLALSTPHLEALAARPAVGVARPRIDIGQSWPLGRVAFSLLPLAGSDRRKTLQTELVRGRVWTHDQIQGVVNVNVPVRQTVLRLRDGGLWVHNPVAPSGECLRLMRELEAQHGPVKHIVLGTLALEHKALAGPFSKCFPDAAVWVQPGQWSFPLPLPMAAFGFPAASGKLRELPAPGATEAPSWAASGEIEYEILGPLRFKAVGAFGETAFFHRSTGSLIITDAVVQVPDSPPAIIQEDPRALLFHARDQIGDEVADTPDARRRGWRRICLFGLTFFPSGIDVALKSSLSDLRLRPKSMDSLSADVPLGLYPWRWARDEEPSFRALQGGLLCAPILQELILNRFPDETLFWARRVARWRFSRVIPCHLSNDLRAGPAEWLEAFSFLSQPAAQPARLSSAPEASRESATPSRSPPAAGAGALSAPAPLQQLLDTFSGAVEGLVCGLRGALGGGSGLFGRQRRPVALKQDLRLLTKASELCTKAGLVEAVPRAE